MRTELNDRIVERIRRVGLIVEVNHDGGLI
jgi:hypothetical protein